MEFGGPQGTVNVTRLNARGIEWLIAHPAKPLPGPPPARAPTPRD